MPAITGMIPAPRRSQRELNESSHRRRELNFTTQSTEHRKSLVLRLLLAGFALVLAFLVLCPAIFAQSPNPAASGSAKDNPEGFTTGWTLGTRFEGSYSSDGGIYDVGSAVG